MLRSEGLQLLVLAAEVDDAVDALALG